MNTTLQYPQSQETESANFWVKVELANSKCGFMSAKMTIYDAENATLLCPRIINKNNKDNEFNSKPLESNTKINLVFHDYELGVFEIWTAKIDRFIAFNNGLDEYSLKDLSLKTSSSLREHERYRVRIPLKLKPIHGDKCIFIFAGCELSEGGVGLWFPLNYKDKIQLGELYEVIFEPMEVAPFSFMAECVNSFTEDLFSEGFKAGFRFTDINNKSIPQLRVQQVIEARGHAVISPYREPKGVKSEHYLAQFWGGYTDL